MGPFSITVLGIALLVTLIVLFSMLRRPALRRIGLRSVGRRKWNTLLVVVGSMVGTALIAGSLVLNDSTGRFQYRQAEKTLGEIDETVQFASQRLPNDTRPIPLFDASTVEGVTPDAIRERTLLLREEAVEVDGVLRALTQETPAEALEAGSENVALASPAVTVVGVDWGELRRFGQEPPAVSLRPDPGEDRVYVSDRLARALELEQGSRLRLRGPRGAHIFTVAEVVPEQGISGYVSRFSSSEGTVLMDIDAARTLLGASPSQLNTLLISNAGDVVSGAENSPAVVDATQQLLEGKGPGGGFQVSQVKKDTLEGGGFQIGDIFLMISSFAILAGILLIINIYTMLAEERKGEMGILRAVALKRGGLVRVFVYEGYAYSVLASLLGTLVGVGVAAGLVWGLNRAAAVFADLFNADLTIPFYVRPQSLVIAASAGLLITFLSVFFTSLRISRLNIVTAIRDLPEQRPLRRSVLRLALQALLLCVGLLLAVAGFTLENGYLMLIGPVLALFGLGLLLSRVLPPRPVWTLLSAGVLGYAYFANELEPVRRANEESPAMFFLEGFFIVLGAVLLVTFNLGVVFAGLRALMRRMPGLASILRIAVAYPSSRRARTGFTLAMFALILYIVTISSIFNSTQSAATERTRNNQLSGYDGFTQSGPVTPIQNFGGRVEDNPVLRDAIEDYTELRAGQVELPEYDAAQYQTPFGPPTGTPAPGAKLLEYLTFVPAGYLASTTDELGERLPEHDSDREAWEALGRDPSLAILTFPYNGDREFLARPKLGPGDSIVLRDPVTGKKVEKKVIARMAPPSGFALGVINGVIVGEGAREEFPSLNTQSTFLFHLQGGVDPVAVNRELKREFAANGAQSFFVEDIIGRLEAFTGTFIRIVQAFLAFGLIVGVAGLAVISARAVHERRREIGTLRAVGFPRQDIRWQFIVESSLVALLGILIGIASGTLGGYNLFRFAVDNPDARFVFPWVEMTLIGLGVWVASLAFTVVPAIRASQVAPVEALRYQG
ncbi:MAG: FtsX-like permease family protein [Chloroflexota bacterium]|nr:FtsX-like permease family protein [Chloroflexota bacterium]